MFESARIKLTIWYLLIIMTVSLIFSAAIYQTVIFEFQRRVHNIQDRLQGEEFGFNPLNRPMYVFEESIKMAKKRVLFILLYANAVVFFFSSLAGYFLAGKTLTPIEETMEKQKRFIADASHELRTPLTALKTSMEVTLKDKNLSQKEAKDQIKENLEDVDNLVSLSNNLLDLANYQNGSNEVERVNLADLVKKACKEIEPLAKKENIKLTLTAEKVFIKADKDKIKQAVLALLDNAVKFSDKKGKVHVNLKNDRKHAVLIIKDNGIGISKKDLPYIFDRFYRADTSRMKQKRDGFGLGLSLVKKIVKSHNGSIKVKSEVGKGTAFTITLPTTA